MSVGKIRNRRSCADVAVLVLGSEKWANGLKEWKGSGKDPADGSCVATLAIEVLRTSQSAMEIEHLSHQPKSLGIAEEIGELRRWMDAFSKGGR
ncbi:hypothetical protein PAAG_02082 [Paracoccidioides lutzii Pb01]|uniref:Uncharacterized protein n=1 Tax=Paracoccidioides lutzii (strain ATCC MYA-826 / Pb01) TaxID=502779 RepID=C1GU87_PARBA|nr:hypothetical protein PAAG_02082 [Paracoccidioides lutzii Pb01]EEH39893.2 hypothetical protein PAAG_02082 [Paracoccidioides lutzii Pb01]